MNMRDVQLLMAANNSYKGGIDGQIGPKHRTAVKSLLDRRGDMCAPGWKRWPIERRSIAVAQIILHFAGFEPGLIDGRVGHNTQEAFNAWSFKQATGRTEVVKRTPVFCRPAGRSGKFPHQRNVRRFYGSPGPGGSVEQQLIKIKLPYTCRLDWDLDRKATRMTLHEKCATSYLDVMNDVLARYGAGEIQRLGLDRFAGSYNPRKMRGGSKWSMHAYGCAVDWYAAPNGLRTRCPQALFCKSEYKDFLDIHQDHGWTPAIRAWGKDAMHFQAADWG